MKAQLIRSHVGLMPGDSATREWFARLPMGFAVWIEVKDGKPTRTMAQNNYLWSAYQQILDQGGEAMGGWTKDDLHEFFLIQHFGADVKEMFGKKRLKPKQRSSRLNKQEFTDLIATIQQFMAERGVVIADPDQSTWDD